MPCRTLRELVHRAHQANSRISDIMLAMEQDESGLTPDVIRARMASHFEVMERAVRSGVESVHRSRTNLIGGDAIKLMQYTQRPSALRLGALNSVSLTAMAYAMAVSEINASMGQIVATPTAGAAGILPGVLVALLDAGQIDRDQVVDGLLTAAAVGMVIANAASISGAQGGCQAEVGSATAMTAAAVVELGGGSPQEAIEAVGLALTNSLGLVCDPVAGLVEVPCLYRNGLHAVAALASAECALAGIEGVIPPDEVIGAMDDIGNQLPMSLRETGLGGLAATATGKRLRREILGDLGDLPEKEEA